MYRLSLKVIAAAVAWTLSTGSVSAVTYSVYYQRQSVNEANKKPTWIFGASFATEMDYRDLSTGKKTSARQDAEEYAQSLYEKYDDIVAVEIRTKGSPSSSSTPPGDSRALAGMKPGGPNDFKKITDGIVEDLRKRSIMLDCQLRMEKGCADLDKEKADLDAEWKRLKQERDLQKAEEEAIKRERQRASSRGNGPYKVVSPLDIMNDDFYFGRSKRSFESYEEAEALAKKTSRARVIDRDGNTATGPPAPADPDAIKTQ